MQPLPPFCPSKGQEAFGWQRRLRSRPASPLAQGSNTSGFAVVAPSAALASSTPAVSSVGAGTAGAGRYGRCGLHGRRHSPWLVCVNNRGFGGLSISIRNRAGRPNACGCQCSPGTSASSSSSSQAAVVNAANTPAHTQCALGKHRPRQPSNRLCVTELGICAVIRTQPATMCGYMATRSPRFCPWLDDRSLAEGMLVLVGLVLVLLD